MVSANQKEYLLHAYNDIRTALVEMSKVMFIELNKNKCSNCSYDKSMGCCSHCVHSSGYYYLSQNDFRLLNHIKRKFKFSKKYGFFDIRKHCCKLPRKLRSNTCLSYVCPNADFIYSSPLNKISSSLAYLRYLTGHGELELLEMNGKLK